MKLNTHLHTVAMLRMCGFLPALEGSTTGDFERWMKGDLGFRASLSEEAQYGGPLGRSPLLGTPKALE